MEKQDLQEQLNQMYKELGKLYYEYKFEEPTPELLPLFDQITTLKNKIEIKVCPNCGRNVQAGALFCGNCGYKLKA